MKDINYDNYTIKDFHISDFPYIYEFEKNVKECKEGGDFTPTHDLFLQKENLKLKQELRLLKLMNENIVKENKELKDLMNKQEDDFLKSIETKDKYKITKTLSTIQFKYDGTIVYTYTPSIFYFLYKETSYRIKYLIYIFKKIINKI